MLRRLLHRVFVRLSSLFGIPDILKRLDTLDFERRSLEESAKLNMSALASHLDRRISDMAGLIAHEVSEQGKHFENRLVSVNEALVAHIEARQSLVEKEQREIDDSLAATSRQLAADFAGFRQSLDGVRRRVESMSSSPTTTHRSEGPVSDSSIDDALYVALEDHFRGSRDLIAERQRNYLPMLPDVISVDAPVVDLGCGRGEWLAVLRSSGIAALGVDSNSVCVAECLENGLEVENSDLVDFLQARPDSSIGAYTLFQVLEHLPFPVLRDVLREMRRSLVPGGRVIAEVPNAKNLRVSAGTFWIDPTHQRPLYPELLQFLAHEVGFASTEALYVNDDSPNLDLSGLPDGAKAALEHVLKALDTAQDFALVATA